ncbi:MAG: hypothetical protein LBD84_06840, partial [Campylobacteraceae bacterium]|nr:hypothetical protein [Campylobacteraceae bacterium]
MIWCKIGDNINKLSFSLHTKNTLITNYTFFEKLTSHFTICLYKTKFIFHILHVSTLLCCFY